MTAIKQIAARLSIVEASASIGVALYVVIASVLRLSGPSDGSALLLSRAVWTTVAIAPLLGIYAWRDPDFGHLRLVTVPTAMVGSLLVLPSLLVAPIVLLVFHFRKPRRAAE